MSLVVGEAFVQVRPDTTGFATSLSQGLKRAAIGFAGIAGAALGIKAAFGATVGAAINFESAFAGVEKTVNATRPQLDALRKGILDMSKTLPASTTEIAAVAEAAGQLGIATPNILGFTKVMIDLGETTNLTADEAATALAKLANVTKLPQDQFDNLGAAVVALGNNGASTEKDIVELGQRLAAAGNIAGLSQADILGFASALSSVGIDAEAGGTAFSKLFTELANATAKGGTELANFAKVSGQSSAEFQRHFKQDAAGATVDFVEGLGRIKDEGGNVFQVLDDLGITEIRMRNALLSSANAGDLLRDALVTGNKAFKDNNALTNEAEKRYKTTASQLKILRNRFFAAGIAIGDKLLPAVNKLITGLPEAFRDAKKFVSEFVDTLKALGIVGVLKVLFAPFVVLVRELPAIFKASASAIDSFGGFLRDNSKIIKIIAGIIGTLLIPRFILLGVQATVSAAKQVAAWVATQLASVKSQVSQTASAAKIVGGWVKMGLTAAVQGAKVVAGWVATAAGAVVQGAISVAQFTLQVAKWVWMGIQAGLQAAKVVVAWVVTSAGAIAAAVVMGVQVGIMVAGWILLGASALLAAAKVALAWVIAMGPIALLVAAVIAAVILIIKNWDKIKAAAAAVWNFVKARFSDLVNFMKTFPGKVINALNALPGLLLGFAGRAMGSLLRGITSGVGGLVKFVSGIPGKILRALGNAGNILFDIGKSIIAGLTRGITSAVGGIKKAVGGIAKKIIGWKGPPSYDKTILFNNGRLIIGGLMDGIDSQMGALKGQLGGITGTIGGIGSPSITGSRTAAQSGRNVSVINNIYPKQVQFSRRDLAQTTRTMEFLYG